MRINALLDAGFRRHDEFKAAAAIFNKLLINNLQLNRQARQERQESRLLID
jgi:hypothetical protein